MAEKISIGEQYKVLADLWTRGQQRYVYLARLYSFLNIAWLGALVVLGQSRDVPQWGLWAWAFGSGVVIMQTWAALNGAREENGYFLWALCAVEKVGTSSEEQRETLRRQCLLQEVGTDNYSIDCCGRSFRLKRRVGMKCLYCCNPMEDFEEIPNCMYCIDKIRPIHDKVLKSVGLRIGDKVISANTFKFINVLHDLKRFFGPKYVYHYQSRTAFQKRWGMRLSRVPLFGRLAYIPGFFLMLHIAAFFLYYSDYMGANKPSLFVFIGF